MVPDRYGAPDGGQPPSFVHIDVQPAVCAPGEDAVLSWVTSGAAEVQVGGITGLPPVGQLLLRPRSSRTLRLLAVSDHDVRVAAAVRVRVVAPARIELLSVPPAPTPRITGRPVHRSGPPAILQLIPRPPVPAAVVRPVPPIRTDGVAAVFRRLGRPTLPVTPAGLLSTPPAGRRRGLRTRRGRKA